MMDEAEVDRRSAIDIYQWLREVCTTRLVTDPPIVLGGQGVIVQVDESLFRHAVSDWILLCPPVYDDHPPIERQARLREKT